MRLLLRLLSIFLLPIFVFAQNGAEMRVSFKKNDRRYELTPDSLSRYLTNDYTSDRDKVTSIFRWITENISYNIRPYYNTIRANRVKDEDEDTGALRPLSERVAIDVLKTRVAFCDGYARLFKTLCDYAGIKSEIITGYAATNMGRGRFGSNHRWNAVYIDSSWYLLDPTWAAGHLSYSANDFIQSYNNYYFLTPAQDFARDHYPEDLQWALLPKPPYINEFRRSPFKTHAFTKNNVFSYKPESGVIEASLGDTLHFELETFGEKSQMFVLDTAFVDSATIANAIVADSVKNHFTIIGNKAVCSYVVQSPSVEWLSVVFNGEVTTRYKLNIRKNDTVSK
jgi:hypothetical protein